MNDSRADASGSEFRVPGSELSDCRGLEIGPLGDSARVWRARIARLVKRGLIRFRLNTAPLTRNPEPGILNTAEGAGVLFPRRRFKRF